MVLLPTSEFSKNFLCMSADLRKSFMCRYVATELATDAVINVGDVKFYLHKVCTDASLQRVQSIEYIAYRILSIMFLKLKNACNRRTD